MTSALAELFPLASFIFALEEREFLTPDRVSSAETTLSTTKTLPHPTVRGKEIIMRHNIHIKLSKPEQAYVAAWTRRVLAVYGFAVIALLATVLFQHLFEQNTGSVARNSPPALTENISAAAPQ